MRLDFSHHDLFGNVFVFRIRIINNIRWTIISNEPKQAQLFENCILEKLTHDTQSYNIAFNNRLNNNIWNAHMIQVSLSFVLLEVLGKLTAVARQRLFFSRISNCPTLLAGLTSNFDNNCRLDQSKSSPFKTNDVTSKRVVEYPSTMMAQHKASFIYCKADPSEFRQFFFRKLF